jgi:glycosyltransferase involved in cell wall biosynthesis
MKIVFFDYVCEPDKPGATGLSAKVWDTAGRLHDYGDEVHIVAPYTVETYPSNDVAVHRFGLPPIGYRNIFGHTLIVLAAWREIEKLRPVDVIHVPEYLSSGILPLLDRKTPVVLTTPGNIHNRIQNNASFDWITDQVFKVTSWLTVKYCARIIATSRIMRQWWEYTGAPSSKIVVIPNGVDTGLFRPIPGSKALLGIPERTKMILYVGRLLSRVKGLNYLFRALCLLAARMDNLELHLVGDGPDREHLQASVHELGIQDIVVFHGWVRQTDLPCYYSAADVTVLPSFAEGQPRVMWEAMACGSAFLGTEGVIDDIVDAQTGFLVPPRDVEALAGKLAQILSDEMTTRSVAERGHEYVRRNMSWDVIAARIREDVYIPLVTQSDMAGTVIETGKEQETHR